MFESVDDGRTAAEFTFPADKMKAFVFPGKCSDEPFSVVGRIVVDNKDEGRKVEFFYTGDKDGQVFFLVVGRDDDGERCFT